ARILRSLMNEVNPDAVKIGLELIERIQALLLSPPVVLLTPIFNDTFKICQVRAVVPSGVWKLVRKTPLSQPPFQVRQDGIGNWNFERYYRLTRSNRAWYGSRRRRRFCTTLWVGDIGNCQNSHKSCGD